MLNEKNVCQKVLKNQSFFIISVVVVVVARLTVCPCMCVCVYSSLGKYFTSVYIV